MGCHTWFYRKVEGPKESEVKSALLESFQNSLSFLENAIGNRDSLDPEMLEVVSSYSQVELIAEKEEVQDLLYRVDSGLIVGDHMKCLYSDWVDFKYEYIPGRGWFHGGENNELPHDLFRNGDYPEDKLFSLEETRKFIEDHTCVVYENSDRDLIKFWNEHPDGMIKFG